MAREFLDKLKACRCSNLHKFAEYCLEVAING